MSALRLVRRLAAGLCACLLPLPLMAQVASSAAAAPPPRPRANYALAARFLPAEMTKLVFDTEVTPHWFTTSDKFWFSFETPSGTDYYLVNPALHTRAPLWNNAKLAAELSELTGFPYDAQHLPVKNLNLVEHDAALRFEVTVRRDAVIPGESPADRARSLAAETKLDLTTRQAAGGVGDKNDDSSAGKKRTLYFRFDLATRQLRRLDGFVPPPARPLWASLSPDRQTVVFARGYNLYMMDAGNYAKALANPADPSIAETQLTTDGVAGFSYARSLVPEVQKVLARIDGKDARDTAGMRAPSVAIHWSQDAKKFALVREDVRKVGELWTIHSLVNPRPVLQSYPYAMPGEANVPVPEIQIFTVASRQRIVIPERTLPLVDPEITISDAPLTNQDREEARDANRELSRLGLASVPYRLGVTARWLSADDSKLYFMDTDRTYREADVCVADTHTGAITTLIREVSNVWLDTRPPRLVGDKEIVWWSERDGWGHYYLYDSAGKLENAVTGGTYQSDRIQALDDAGRVMYFTAEGREHGEDPYYTHLYRVNLDGTGLRLLTPGNFSHAIAAPDDGKYFVDTFSRVDTAPRSVLLDDQGAQIADLATADLSHLLEAGYEFPTPFHVKAADGITDLYGVMYKPFNFDPQRKYPIIEYVYPGPQTESVTKTFTPKDPQIPLAQLGFIVIEVGNRGGSPQRDKWYDAYGYGNLRDYGLADKKAAAEELAARYPFIDIGRVGIWGHSGGGFMTAAALLQYPDFFKAGWSESGNHENNVYNKFWSEKNDGVREEAQKDGTVKFIYDIEKNSALAKNLKGHLMLTSGDMDDNVSMVNTMRLANALIHADKRFEMLVFPGMRHSYQPIADYVLLRRMDFFAHWLLGDAETGADILELQNEKQATPSKRFPE